VLKAKKIMLPGVGNFAAIAAMKKYDSLIHYGKSTRDKIPFFGVCLGMATHV